MDRMPANGDASDGEGRGAVAGRRRRVASPAAKVDAAPGGHACLARTIETDIIPRLMLVQDALRSGRAGGTATEEAALPPSGIDSLIEGLLAADDARAADFLAAVRAHGLSFEQACLDLLAPAARKLGEMWVDDSRNFAEVTVGLCRLQRMLREFGADLPGEMLGRPNGLRALLMPVPGEQHTYGLSMVMEFFRRAGWDVDGGPGMTLAELRPLLRRDWFDVVGFSVSVSSGFGPLAACVRTARHESRNPAVGVIVGGKIFAEHPELATQVGADATAEDARQAPLQAERLVGLLTRASA